MRHLRSLALTVAALACFVPASSFASSARIDGLGLQSDYVQDYVNVMHYPSTIVRYQNLVYGDLGIKDVSGGDLSDFEDNNGVAPQLDTSARAMGAFLKLWKNQPGVFGVQLNENAGALSPAYGAQYWNRNRNESFNLLWGDDFGSVTAGFQFNRSSSRLEDDTDFVAPYDWSPASLSTSGNNSRQIMNNINASLGLEGRNSTGFGGGISFGWDAYGRSHTADIGVQYRTMSLDLSTGAPGATIAIDDNGASAMAINARSQFATGDNTYLTPVINYWRQDMGWQLTDEATPANNVEYENTVKGWNVGLAESWVLRDQDLLTLGFAFGNQEVDYEDPNPEGDPFTVSYSTTPAIFGATEIHPMSWFHVRLGASKALTSKLEYEEVGGTPVVIKDAPLGYTVGAGFRIGGRLDVDAVVNQDFAFTGGWFASGNDEVPFSRLSATYRW
jgi:hypothetical protein